MLMTLSVSLPLSGTMHVVSAVLMTVFRVDTDFTNSTEMCK
jgi:hypothetical protein